MKTKSKQIIKLKAFEIQQNVDTNGSSIKVGNTFDQIAELRQAKQRVHKCACFEESLRHKEGCFQAGAGEDS